LETIIFKSQPFTEADVANLTDDFVTARLREAYDTQFAGGLDFFVSKDFYDGVEQIPPVYESKYTQFYLFFGGPQPGYTTLQDREED